MKLDKILMSAVFLSTHAILQVANASVESTESTAETVADESESVGCCCCDSPFMFDGLMWGVGVGFEGSKYKVKLEDFFSTNISDSKTVNRFNGVFCLAYGKTFDEFYLGLVVNGDLGSSKTSVLTHSYDELKNSDKKFEHDDAVEDLEKLFEVNSSSIKDPRLGLKIKSAGFSSTVALRFGYVPNSATGLMMYLDLGATCRQVKLKIFDRVTIDAKIRENTESYDEVKINRIIPMVRFGVQKKVCDDVVIDFNGEYRFEAKKTKETVTLRNSGSWGIRLSAVYYIKL